MGRGLSQSTFGTGAALISRRQARRDQRRIQTALELKQAFPDHTVENELTGKEYEIADPFLKEANGYLESGEYQNLGNGGWTTITPAVRPSSRLYHYCPKMKGNRGSWLITSLVLDHKSGNIFAVSEVQTPVPGSGLIGDRMSSYKVVDCGTDLDSACDTAQQLYDDTWSDFKHSYPRGKGATRQETDMEPMGTTDSPNYKENIFESDKERIKANLKIGLAERLRFDEWIEKNKAEKEQTAARVQAEADKLGYDLKIGA